MDLAMLAKELTAFLVPFLPFLVKAGEKVAEEAGKKLGGDAWEKAKGLWGKLRSKVEAKPAAQDAVQKAVTRPQDERVKAAVELQVEDILREDTILAAEIARLWEEAKAAGVTVIAIAWLNTVSNSPVVGFRKLIGIGGISVTSSRNGRIVCENTFRRPRISPASDSSETSKSRANAST